MFMKLSSILRLCKRICFFIRKKCLRKLNDENLTAAGLVEHANRCLHLPTIYVWDGMGETVTKDLLNRLKTCYTRYYTEQRYNYLLGFADKEVRGFDCSGLLKSYVMGGLENFMYDASRDLNSLALYEKATKKGPIETLPEIPGICLYKKGHTAVYIGNGLVIESTDNPDFGDGVVLTKISDRPWEQWYEMPWVKYEQFAN